jgi:hypothetical protein
MRELSISEEDALRVMNDPDLTYSSYGKQEAEDVFEGGRLLRVVFVDSPESVRTEEVSRYAQRD